MFLFRKSPKREKKNMQFVFAFLIFCIVLFLYMHIQFHLKTSDELELYEIDDVSKERFEEICDLRQPVLFQFFNQPILESVKKQNLFQRYPSFDVKVREKNDVNYIQLPFENALQLFRSDKNSSYYSENNSDFLQETTFVKNLSYNDSFLRPYMVSNCKYDVLFGSTHCTTPCRFELNYRTFFLLTEGTAKIKLAPPCSTKYFNPIYDYENFEFRSPINVWSPQPEYKADYSKIKCLEFTLLRGKTLYLPAYWWYSIEFSEDAFISCFRYKTYMNNVAISPYVAMYALQNQNVKRVFAKKADIAKLQQTDPDNQEKATNSSTIKPAEDDNIIIEEVVA